MVERFRKKPLVVDAVLYDGTNYEEIAGFVGSECWISRKIGDPILIETLEGRMNARPGDWIIKGVEGQFYPCNPDIFGATYEAIEEE